MSIFIERKFELADKHVVARFYLPERAGTGEFTCQWLVEWPDMPASGTAHGEDSIQALMLAMKRVHIDLVESAAYKKGQLTLWLQADLDLPPTWGAGPLYYVPDR